jgi:hypothetical protein
VEIRQVPVPLGDVEAVPDEELVGYGEADVADRQILDQAPVGPVEQGDRRQRRRLAEGERPAEVVERQAGIDDVLDDQDVAVRDLAIEVLEQADACVAAGVGVRAVARQLDEVERVQDRDRAREVGEEDEARLQWSDEERLAALVVARALLPELPDARRQLLAGEVDLADGLRLGYDASSRRYRCAKRSRSRL